MSTAKIILNKTVEVNDTYVKAIRLTLSVAEAENVTKNIFVTIFHPQSSYYGDAYYEFSNVAYYDELTSVKDVVVDQNRSCAVRVPCVTLNFSSASEMNDWLSVVYSDIQRLIDQIKSFNISTYTEVSITDNSITEKELDIPKQEVSEQYPEQYTQRASSSTNTDVVALSFDGN